MKTNLQRILAYAAALLLFTFVSFGQNKAVELKETRITLQFDKVPLATVFRHLMEIYDVPIGFEESTLDQKHNDFDFETNLPTVGLQSAESGDGKVKIAIEAERVFEPTERWITVKAKNRTLEDVLDLIVSQMENYKWETNDGVVDIFPVRGRDPRYEKLLELNIAHFSIEKDSKVRVITTNLRALPELNRFLNDNSLFWNGARIGSSIRIHSQWDRRLEVGMNYSNITFKELLNKITKIKRGGWILKKSDLFGTKEKEYIDIDI